MKANIVSQRKCHVLTRTFTCTILVLGGDVHSSILVSEGEPFLHVERDALSIPGDSKHVCRYWPENVKTKIVIFKKTCYHCIIRIIYRVLVYKEESRILVIKTPSKFIMRKNILGWMLLMDGVGLGWDEMGFTRRSEI